MIEHILLAMLSGLLASKYDKQDEKFLRYLWIFSCMSWIINVIGDVIWMVE